MSQSYKLLNDSKVNSSAKKGTIVYLCCYSDYGLARDDERALGYPCVSVTLNSNGDYPSFVVPEHDLEKTEESK